MVDPAGEADVRAKVQDLVREAFAAQNAGNDGEATRLFDAASNLDADALADILQATGQDTAADARDANTDRSALDSLGDRDS